jgi:hypothetical protein
MKKLITTILILLSLHSFSQSDSTFRHLKVLKISALSFRVPYVGSSARISYEYGISDKFTLEHEVGFNFYDSKGFMLRTDVKRYLNSGNNSNYLGIDLFYKNQNYTTSDTLLNNYTFYEVHKNAIALSVKYGQVKTFNFGLIIDFYFGVGIRLIQNRNTLSTIENSSMEATSDYGPNLIMNKAGTRLYPNILFGLKIGYKLNK